MTTASSIAKPTASNQLYAALVARGYELGYGWRVPAGCGQAPVKVLELCLLYAGRRVAGMMTGERQMLDADVDLGTLLQYLNREQAASSDVYFALETFNTLTDGIPPELMWGMPREESVYAHTPQNLKPRWAQGSPD